MNNAFTYSSARTIREDFKVLVKKRMIVSFRLAEARTNIVNLFESSLFHKEWAVIISRTAKSKVQPQSNKV